MKFMIGAACVALAGLTVPAMAQSPTATATAQAPAAQGKKVVRMACKQEAVTGSFTRKARQCRHAVVVTEKPKPQEAARNQTTPAAPAATPPAPPEANSPGGAAKEQ